MGGAGWAGARRGIWSLGKRRWATARRGTRSLGKRREAIGKERHVEPGQFEPGHGKETHVVPGAGGARRWQGEAQAGEAEQEKHLEPRHAGPGHGKEWYMERGKAERGRELEIADAENHRRQLEQAREGIARGGIGIRAGRKLQGLGETKIAQRIGEARDAGCGVVGGGFDVEVGSQLRARSSSFDRLRMRTSRTFRSPAALMVSLSNHEGESRAFNRF